MAQAVSLSLPGRLLLIALLLATLSCGRMGDPIPPGSRLMPPPENVTAKGRGEEIILAWLPPSRSFGGGPGTIAGYLVERQSWPPGEEPCRECPVEYTELARIDAEARAAKNLPATSYSDKAVEAGFTYSYRITGIAARERLGISAKAVQIVFYPIADPEVEVYPVEEGARINYKGPPSPPDTRARGLAVFAKGGKLLARMAPEDDEGKIIGLPNGEEVSLDIRWSVVTRGGALLESSTRRFKVVPSDVDPPGPPGDLAAFPEAGAVRLMWAPPRGEQYHKVIILRATQGGELEKIAEVAGDSASYLDEAVSPGVTYTYGCKGIDRVGNVSGLSPEARITP